MTGGLHHKTRLRLQRRVMLRLQCGQLLLQLVAIPLHLANLSLPVVFTDGHQDSRYIVSLYMTCMPSQPCLWNSSEDVMPHLRGVWTAYFIALLALVVSFVVCGTMVLEVSRYVDVAYSDTLLTYIMAVHAVVDTVCLTIGFLLLTVKTGDVSLYNSPNKATGVAALVESWLCLPVPLILSFLQRQRDRLNHVPALLNWSNHAHGIDETLVRSSTKASSCR